MESQNQITMCSLNTQFPPKFILNSKNIKEFQEQIRAALEEHGCFELICDEYQHFNDIMVVALEQIFGLNSEIKSKIPAQGRNYKGISTFISRAESYPYYEAFSVVVDDEEAKKFTEKLWPGGNEKICQTISSVNRYLLELAKNVADTVAASYGLDNEDNRRFPNINSVSRMTRYTPPKNGETIPGLSPHTDGSYLTILWQNGINGLQIKSKEGNWLDVNIEKGSFLVFPGILLKVWSNGKIMAPEHKVMVSGDKDRYSYLLSFQPTDDEVVKPQSELIESENQARFAPFVYKDLLAHLFGRKFEEGAFEEFAGISL